MTLERLLRRLERIEMNQPQPEPWPPEEGGFSYCLFEKLGRPAERMSFMDMYEAVAEKVWNEDLNEIN